MALPTTFGTTTNPTGVQLDNCLAAVAAMAIWNCSATGTNTIALTSTANQPAVGAYVDRQRFQFVAPNSTSGAVTAAVNSLGALPVYLITGAQAGSGDLLSGFPYLLIYLAALNSSAGGFMVISATPTNVTVPVAAAVLPALSMFNNASTAATKIDIQSANAVLITAAGLPKLVSSVGVTIDLTTVGANGMDVGSRPTSGWVYCYVISNGSVTAGLATATSPTAGAPSPIPSGYVYSAYAGAMYCDGSQNLLRTLQRSRRSKYKVIAATNTAIAPNIANGTAGTFSDTNPVLAAVTVTGNSGFAPLTAGSIFVNAYNKWKNGTAASLMVAPNTDWGGSNNGEIGSAGQVWPIYLGASATTAGVSAEIVLEGATLAWVSSNAGGAISAAGWTDYYSTAG